MPHVASRLRAAGRPTTGYDYEYKVYDVVNDAQVRKGEAKDTEIVTKLQSGQQVRLQGVW